MKTYVIAGTYNEAKSWINKNYQERVAIGDKQVTTGDYVYVSKAQDLRGILNPHGVFIGNWMGRPDIYEIVQRLMMCSTNPNAALGKIYKDLQPKVRPTPKIPAGKPITSVNQVVQEAADSLSKHIDQALLDEFTKKINGGLIDR
jgi:hypothetical protein